MHPTSGRRFLAMVLRGACAAFLVLPSLLEAAPARFAVDTTTISRGCESGGGSIGIPHLRPLRRAGQDVSDAVNGAILQRFGIDDPSLTLDCGGWSDVEFDSKISRGVLWIDWNGCYMGPYETCYAEHFAFDLLDGGKVLEKVEFDPFELLDTGSLAVIAPDWSQECLAALDEARECAGFDAYCSCEEPAYKISKSGVSASLSDDCYPHVALACTPSLVREATLDQVDPHLTPLGRKVLRGTRYLKSQGLERYLIYRKLKPAEPQ